ncbi:uncharacterized protein [Onthophagus taurus]|uniref:uncharacterized protein isoform X1 n=2 Tax=Onthophagus taurus TaxID=166361 RepID=UPI0039BDBEDB
MESQKTYNVLLVGETGVGKSTFINTIFNYLAYDKLSDINQLKHSVGVRFTLMDDDFTERRIVIGEDSNEGRYAGKSATIQAQNHRIPLPDGSILNIIDTPGLGDNQGIENDHKNFEKVLEFISEMEYLHGICIMLKPNNSRLSVIFEYCLTTILGQLDENIRKNIIFLFSNGRSSFYTPGDTQIPLEEVLKSADTTSRNPIPFNKQNTFCVESDWFRYVAAKSAQVKFNDNQVSNFEDSFKKSSEEVIRMIKYIKSLAPQQIKGLLSINEAKRIIRRLSATIASNLATQRKNWRQLNAVKKNNSNTNKKPEENLKPGRKLPGNQPPRVRTHQSPATTKLGGSSDRNCNHNHQSKFYEQGVEPTITLEVKIDEDPDVKTNQNENETDTNKAKQEQDDIDGLNHEFITLLHAAAQFNIFLKENVPFNPLDEIQDHLEKMKKESETLNDKQNVTMYHNILKKYEVKKKSIIGVTLKDIDETIKKLFNLKHSGPSLKKKLGIDDEKKTETEQNEKDTINVKKPEPKAQGELEVDNKQALETRSEDIEVHHTIKKSEQKQSDDVVEPKTEQNPENTRCILFSGSKPKVSLPE